MILLLIPHGNIYCSKQYKLMAMQEETKGFEERGWGSSVLAPSPARGDPGNTNQMQKPHGSPAGRCCGASAWVSAGCEGNSDTNLRHQSQTKSQQ